MAKKRFLVIADSFINMRLIRADMPVKDRVIEIETDPEQGGMRPGSNLVECDENGNPVTTKASKAKRTAASHNDGTGGAGAVKDGAGAAGNTGGTDDLS